MFPLLRILTLNGGSSSLKFSIYEIAPGLEEKMLQGQFERIGTAQARLEVTKPDGSPAIQEAVASTDHSSAVAHLLAKLNALDPGALDAVGHRLVQGGPIHRAAEVVTPALLRDLKQLSALDPLHLPDELMILCTAQEHKPHIPHVACFDTAFHRDLPRVAQLLPLPREFTQDTALQRFGFHGLSYEYILGELARVAGGETAEGRVIIAHLGSGASMAAVVDGRCVETTMGFSPAAGLVMASRPGDLDPGIWEYLLRTRKITPEGLQELVYRKCGLKGVSGSSGDIRDLLAAQDSDSHARDAIDLFCHQARKALGALVSVLDGVDTLIFTGGIGEHAALPRMRICAGLSHLGLQIDDQLNQQNQSIISTSGSTVTVRVMKTNEELVIARHTARLAQSQTQSTPLD